jgi:hypothetical protein
MKISKFHLAHLRNDAHFQFHSEAADLLARLQSGFQLDVHTISAISDYKNLLQREDEALKKIVKSPLTEKIHKLDVLRDAHYTALLAMNKSRCLDLSASIADAALRIQIVLDTYGNVTQKTINEQTSAIFNLLQELNSSKYAADVQAVGIKNWITDLGNQNTALENLVKERYDEAGAKTGIVLRQARSETDAAYYVIVERINAFLVVQTPAPYENFVNTLNVVIAKYAVKKHHRHNTDAVETEKEE